MSDENFTGETLPEGHLDHWLNALGADFDLSVNASIIAPSHDVEHPRRVVVVDGEGTAVTRDWLLHLLQAKFSQLGIKAPSREAEPFSVLKNVSNPLLFSVRDRKLIYAGNLYTYTWGQKP